MATYTKETALYDTGKIGTDITNAGQTAKGYLTNVTSGGVFVHEYSTSDVTPSTAGANGVHISDDIDIVRNGEVVASYGTAATIGKLTAAHSVIDSDGQRFYASNGTTQLANIGYGEGQAQSGTAVAPYYTLGTRADNSTVGNYSIAEGSGTTASGYASHAEGWTSFATAPYAHAEGGGTSASGIVSHAEGGGSVASGMASHAQNYNTKASSDYQTALGKYNEEDANDTYAVIVGNGTGTNARSNALTVDWSGNVKAAGYVRDTIISATPTITRTSGGNVSNVEYQRSGNVAQLRFTLKYSTSVVAGGNVFEGTIPNGYRPSINVYGCGYYGEHAIICLLSTTGGIVCRNASNSAVTISAASGAGISFTYIIE